MKQDSKVFTVCIVGLGYVGLPLAEAFSESLPVIGFDNNELKIENLKSRYQHKNLVYTSNPEDISKADFVAICVPTPLTPSKEPDLSFIEESAKTIGKYMKRGCLVVLESTVYPGVTEEFMIPILEKNSGLKCGADFKIGYSPERINPGDKEHVLGKITKVVAGIDEETTLFLEQLYSKVAANVFPALDIKTAEAAKVIENIQRDLNIALMNELSIIFDLLGIDTRAVIAAASTKWNFQRYLPGLVGGHCIPVDPYYMVHRAKQSGYRPQVIIAGRTINDSIPKHIAGKTVKALNRAQKITGSSRVLVMGLTYKENVADTRESPVRMLIKSLQEYGVTIEAYDPLLKEAEEEFGIKTLHDFSEASGFDAVIITVAHDEFRNISLRELKGAMRSAPILFDVQRTFDREKAVLEGINYLCL